MFFDSISIQEIASYTIRDRARNLILPTREISIMNLVSDGASLDRARDLGMWSLLYQNPKNTVGLLGEVALGDPNPKIRKSAAWALMKLGAHDVLRESIQKESDANIGFWKTHLLMDAQDRTNPFDDRRVRRLDNKLFDFTMPLEVEGTVEFKDKSGNWHTYVTGPISNERLIGTLTPAVNTATFDSNIVLQKRIKNINESGYDHIEGYNLKGISRLVSDNVMRHQYEGISQHDVYLSGIVGDESKGKIENVTATVQRMADTYLANSSAQGFVYPHSVRGSFRGFVFMNPSILGDPSTQIDGLLQIISPTDPNAGHLVNGIFYGTFRGIPEDLDQDGLVELNGIEMQVDKTGAVLDSRPKSSDH